MDGKTPLVAVESPRTYIKRNYVSSLRNEFVSNLANKVRISLHPEYPLDINLSREREYYKKKFATLKSFEEVDAIQSHAIDEDVDHQEQLQHEGAMHIYNWANVFLLAFKIKEFSLKIFFYCQQPSAKGGDTSLLSTDIVLKKMEETLPEFVSKLRRLGYIFQTKSAKEDEKTNVISKTWKWLFKTEDKLEAEPRAKEMLGCTSVEPNEDGSAVFVYEPLDPIKQVWFHHLVGRNEVDTDSYFGDGTPLPRTALKTYRKIMFESCVDIKWQKGDVLLVDNFSVQHARHAGKEPHQIFVFICK